MNKRVVTLLLSVALWTLCLVALISACSPQTPATAPAAEDEPTVEDEPVAEDEPSAED